MAEIEPEKELFRPSKRRKFYRKRAEDDETETNPPSEQPTSLSPAPQDSEQLRSPPPLQVDDDGSIPIAEILRRRKATQRKGGVEFTNTTVSNSTTAAPIDALVRRVEKSDPINTDGITSRFAPQTGLVAEETDKHMAAYIEAEIAKRTQQSRSSALISSPLSPNGTSILPASNQRNPASLGKLHEIDLGPDATARNIALTEAAVTGYVPPPPPPKPPKARIGRNGKPYIPKPRPRNRRNSDDIARDKVVEDILRENRLEGVYEEPAKNDRKATATEALHDVGGEENDGTADDRLAEQFRREFLDAMSQRKEKANKVPAAPSTGKAGEDKRQGPKLGGSRSERAKMREREEAAARAAAAKGKR